MLRRAGRIAVLVLALLTQAAAAYGASPSASAPDPLVGSPPGAVYQLPFEKGRADASPKGNGGTNFGGDGSAGGGSLYRSENNFGSSSRVPGNPSPAAQPSGKGGGGRASAGAVGGAGGGGVGGGGGPNLGGMGGGGATTGIARAAETAAKLSGNTSTAATIAVLFAIGLASIAIGAAAVRTNRLSARR